MYFFQCDCLQLKLLTERLIWKNFATRQKKKYYALDCQAVICQMLNVDPWDMPGNFCFHVYAQKSLFIGENGNEFFYSTLTRACEL